MALVNSKHEESVRYHEELQRCVEKVNVLQSQLQERDTSLNQMAHTLQQVSLCLLFIGIWLLKGSDEHHVVLVQELYTKTTSRKSVTGLGIDD